MENSCQFCKKIFSNKSNLKNHLKNARYCLNLRNIDNNVIYNCTYCNKELSSKTKF